MENCGLSQRAWRPWDPVSSYNKIMIASLAWRLLKIPQVFTHKSWIWNIIRKALIKKSFIWQNIFMGNLICANNTAKSPKNGNSISLWNHRWIPNNPPLRQLVQGPLVWKDEISTIWNNHSWNWDVLNMYIPRNIIDKANTITLNLDPSNSDKPYWTENSNFSTKSVQQTLVLTPCFSLPV